MFLTQWQVGFHLGFHRCKVASSILPQRNFRMSVQICKYVYVNEFRYVLTRNVEAVDFYAASTASAFAFIL